VTELPPEQQAGAEGLDIRQHARTGGGESRHRLEVGIDRPTELYLAAKHERHGAEGRDEQPDQRHD